MGALADAGPGATAAVAGRPEDDLLQQIRLLLEQYLSLGSTTPVAGQAQQLADAIDQVTGGGGSATDASMGATQGGPPDAGDYGSDMPPDMMLPQEGEPPADTSKKSFADANKNASDRLRKRNAKK